MPLVSDVAKIPFSGLATSKALATGNWGDATANAILGLGQIGWAVGKYGLPKWLPGSAVTKLNDRWRDDWKTEFGKEVYLLELGIQLVTLMTTMHGSATDKGQNYELGSASLELAWENLNDATAGDRSWSGDAAEAYNVQNAAQLDLATALANLDTQIAAILALQAGQLKDHKLYLTFCRGALTAAIPVAVILRMSGPWAYWNFVIAVFGFVMLAASTITVNMMGLAAENAVSIDTVTAQYSAIASSAVVTGVEYAPKSGGAPAQASTVGQFDTLDGAGEAETPGIGSPATTFGQPVAAGDPGSTEGGAIPAGYLPGAPAAAAAPAASSYPVAGVGQAARPSASKPSTGPRHAAQEPAWEADIVEELPADDIGGAAGAGESERAPVDAAATAADQAQQRAL
jgi:hypothetical protein